MYSNHNTNSARKQADENFLAKRIGDRLNSAKITDGEWAQIAPDKVIVATENRSWLYQPRSQDDRFCQPMERAGSIATTGKLLDGAIAAARYAVNSDVRPPALTAIRWVWRLAGDYHLCFPTVRLMKKAAQCFATSKRWNLAEWASQRAKEEMGHDLLALRDINSLGYNAEAVVKALIPSATLSLTDYFIRSVKDDDPIDCVGYSYTMERMGLGVDEKYIQKVEMLLPKNTHATRCRRVHSSVGVDTEHTEETVEMIAKLTAFERIRVARACYETAILCFSPPSKDYISDEELQKILAPLKL